MLEELLQTADFITINCAYNPNLHHMIDEEQFKMMKKTAYIVNASRGPIMNEAKTCSCIKTNEIEGALLTCLNLNRKLQKS